MRWTWMAVALALLASAGLSGCSTGKGAGPGPLAEKSAAAQPAPAVAVDLHYVGLPADSQEANACGGYGTSKTSAPTDDFTRSLKLPAGKAEYAQCYGMNLGSVAIESADGKPVALYADLNKDGKLSEGEKLMPTPGRDPRAMIFLTPDFQMKNQDGSSATYRVRFTAMPGQSYLEFGACCALEGKAKIDGVTYRMLLLDGNNNGVFLEYGTDRYMLVPEGQNNFWGSNTLSSAIPLENKGFYHLRITGDSKVTLQKDVSPTGLLAIRMAAPSDLKVNCSGNVCGIENETATFQVNQDQKLPVGKYRMDYGMVNYGQGPQGNGWYTQVTDIPEFLVDAGTTATLALGDPKLTVKAINENRRNSSSSKPAANRRVFQRGETVFLTPEVKGKAGESYLIFQNQGAQQSDSAVPKVTIQDASGKTIATGTIPYG